jgi:hypothetical protein
VQGALKLPDCTSSLHVSRYSQTIRTLKANQFHWMNTESTAESFVQVVPFGGVPNIVIADENSCLIRSGTLKKCPNRSCLPGAPDCSWYMSMFYHWDNMAYGGSPAQHFFLPAFQTAPVGVYNGNQAYFPLAAETEVFQEVPEVDFSMCSFKDTSAGSKKGGSGKGGNKKQRSKKH